MIPVAVDQRCEFLSELWIAEATSFLEAAAARPAFAATRFSLSESFTDAPAPLADADGCVAWHFDIDRGRVRVGTGERADTDVRVRGDYQAALGYAQLVHAAGAEAVERGHRELRHRFGPRAVQIDGRLPEEPGVASLISELHDHMAARTIENPHYAHRVAQLGLEDHVAQLTERGYAVIENAVTPEFADDAGRSRGR